MRTALPRSVQRLVRKRLVHLAGRHDRWKYDFGPWGDYRFSPPFDWPCRIPRCMRKTRAELEAERAGRADLLKRLLSTIELP